MRKTEWSLFIALAAAVVIAASAALAKGPDEKVAALFESSIAHEVTGNTDRALADAQEILRADPKNYVAHYRIGWLYYLKGRYADSIRFYEKATGIAPKAVESKLAVMLPLMASRQWAMAEAIGKEIVSRSPDNYLASSRLAFVYFSQGKYKAAEDQYKKVLEAYPSEIEMMLGLGWTYVRQGRKADARDMFEKVLSIRRQNQNAIAGLGAL